MLLTTVVLMLLTTIVLAPLVAKGIYSACSRRRTGDGLGLVGTLFVVMSILYSVAHAAFISAMKR